MKASTVHGENVHPVPVPAVPDTLKIGAQLHQALQTNACAVWLVAPEGDSECLWMRSQLGMWRNVE